MVGDAQGQFSIFIMKIFSMMLNAAIWQRPYGMLGLGSCSGCQTVVWCRCSVVLRAMLPVTVHACGCADPVADLVRTLMTASTICTQDMQFGTHTVQCDDLRRSNIQNNTSAP
jgi:hypothetical protein